VSLFPNFAEDFGVLAWGFVCIPNYVIHVLFLNGKKGGSYVGGIEKGDVATP